MLDNRSAARVACQTQRRLPERGLSSIREIGVPAFFDLIDDPATFVFTFVRNPYTRLISAYRDKFRHPIGRSDYYLDALRYFGLKLLRLDRTEPLPFEWFVDLATGTCRSGSDGHWMLMTSLVPSTSLECSFLGRVERFDEDFRMVLDRIGEPSVKIPAVNATGRVVPADFITSPLQARIYRAYQDDFERFEYPYTLPVA